MQTTANTKAIINYRIKTTLWLTITALVLLPPFAINNFIQARYSVGLTALIIIVILFLQAWNIYQGRDSQKLAVAGLVPAMIVFLAICFQNQQIIGALWCYPIILVFHFILPRRLAIYANICMLIVAVPFAWYTLDPSLAVRVTVTLLAVTIFSAIFVLIIEDQQQELEQKESQRRDSMASASHELRTPLATMMAQIEAMRDGVRPLDQKQLTSLFGSVEHLNNLVEDLFVLSLADIKALTCHKDSVNFSAILNETVNSAKSKLEDHNLTVVNTVDDAILIDGDIRRLRQIIDNLLENCCRYSTPGGLVYISLKKRNDSFVELKITDTGPGVSNTELALLFDRFYRADRSRSRQYGGSGLGLPLIKALVEVHKGKVKAFHATEGGLGISIKFPMFNNI